MWTLAQFLPASHVSFFFVVVANEPSASGDDNTAPSAEVRGVPGPGLRFPEKAELAQDEVQQNCAAGRDNEARDAAHGRKPSSPAIQ